MYLKPAILLALASLLAGTVQSQTFVLDCTNAAGACSNDCYGVNIADSPQSLTWDKPTANAARSRRRRSGCKMPGNDRSPCGKNTQDPVDPYYKNGDECDEYPYASVTQGGTNAVLACTAGNENRDEGTQLATFYNAANGCGGNAPCNFDVMLKDGTYDNIGYCNGKVTANTGDEFQLQNGQYVKASPKMRIVRDAEGNETYEPHIPDPAKFILPHERRQFLLSDGHRTLLLGRGSGKSYNGTMVVHGDGTSAMVMKELFGDEKGPQFRPVSI